MVYLLGAGGVKEESKSLEDWKKKYTRVRSCVEPCSWLSSDKHSLTSSPSISPISINSAHLKPEQSRLWTFVSDTLYHASRNSTEQVESSKVEWPMEKGHNWPHFCSLCSPHTSHSSMWPKPDLNFIFRLSFCLFEPYILVFPRHARVCLCWIMIDCRLRREILY